MHVSSTPLEFPPSLLPSFPRTHAPTLHNRPPTHPHTHLKSMLDARVLLEFFAFFQRARRFPFGTSPLCEAQPGFRV
jgi:hypothetical protein